jgi:hypothetical protein
MTPSRPNITYADSAVITDGHSPTLGQSRRKPMSHDTDTPALDLVRWTFTIDAARRAEIEGYLHDQGADVLVRDGTEFLVTWDEPEEDLAEVIETIWSINGEPFDVIEEGFRRLELHTLHHSEDEPAQEAA